MGDDLGGSSLSLCRDCYATVLAVSRREAGGVAREYVVYWDEVTAGKVSEGARRLYQSVLRAAGGKQ
jgi:hypothetical protein